MRGSSRGARGSRRKARSSLMTNGKTPLKYKWKMLAHGLPKIPQIIFTHPLDIAKATSAVTTAPRHSLSL